MIISKLGVLIGNPLPVKLNIVSFKNVFFYYPL